MTPRRVLAAIGALSTSMLLGLMATSTPVAAVPEPRATYKTYLYTQDDAYSCARLAPYVNEEEPASLRTVHEKAVTACRAIESLRVSGLGLTDDYNPTIVAQGKSARVPIWKPPTLFAPYALTYDPDSPWRDRIGWPVRIRPLQQEGYDLVQAGKPSCITFISGGTLRLSPYTSHCSAYVAWVAEQVYGINLYPTALGDFCHAASEQRDRMLTDPANWKQVGAVDAQVAANSGKLVLAAKKKGDPTKPAHNQNGHIAVVLPNIVGVAGTLQDGVTYPDSPAVNDSATFRELITLYGPEIAQAGGLNFAHTLAANGFSSYYPPGAKAGVTPIDEVIEFFVYRHETRIDI